MPASEVAPPFTVATVDGVDPLRDPTAYAVTTEGPEPPAVTTVTVTGDVMLGRRVGDHLAQVGDPTAALRPMARRLAGADLTIGNLESTLSQAGAPRQGGDSFAASPSVRAGLELAGLRRAVAGEQPHRRLRAAGAGRDRTKGAVWRLRAGGRRRRPRAGRPGRRSSSATASGSAWWPSTRSARHPRRHRVARGHCGCGWIRAPGRWCAPDLDRVTDLVRSRAHGSTLCSCCRTGARSTRTRLCATSDWWHAN